MEPRGIERCLPPSASSSRAELALASRCSRVSLASTSSAAAILWAFDNPRPACPVRPNGLEEPQTSRPVPRSVRLSRPSDRAISISARCASVKKSWLASLGPLASIRFVGPNALQVGSPPGRFQLCSLSRSIMTSGLKADDAVVRLANEPLLSRLGFQAPPRTVTGRAWRGEALNLRALGSPAPTNSRGRRGTLQQVETTTHALLRHWNLHSLGKNGPGDTRRLAIAPPMW
jgi:hypothetical protein